MQTKQVPTGASGPKILVVDDSKLIRLAANKILESDYEVLLASDGEEAWEMISSDQGIRVVFSDLTMPRLDGFALLKRLRQSEDPYMHGLPLIIMTTDGDDETRRETALRLGATDFISKPFNSIDLKARAKAHAAIESITRELKNKAEQLERNSSRDPLTGLKNRSYFVEKLWQDCSYSARHHAPLSVLRVDIDGFNQIFVQSGRDAANRVITQLSEKITPCLRDEDTAARIGLSTFVISAPGSTLPEAQSLAQKIIRQVGDMRVRIDDETMPVSLSIGVVSPALGNRFRTEEILQQLETECMLAMEQQGSSIVPAPSSEAEVLERDVGMPTAVNSIDQALELIAAGKLAPVQDNLAELIRRVQPLIQLAEQLKDSADDQ